MKFQRWKQIFSGMSTTIVVVVLFIIFVVAVFWFRRPPEPREERINSIAEVLQPDPISQAILHGLIDTESKDATLKLLVNNKIVGQANRGTKDDHYFLSVNATLPEIDREVFYYQLWIVRPIPYDYLPVGELVTNEEGVFMIEWEAAKDQDYSGYMQLVITRQEYAGSTDPQVHIVEGEFGK